MDKHQAEKIVNGYGGAITASVTAFRKESTLPCSKARIRYAYCVYISAIIKDLGHLPKDLGRDLVATYGMLDSFVPDEDADRLNGIWKKIASHELVQENPDHKKQIGDFFSLFSRSLRNTKYLDEINDYIAECYKEHAAKPHRV